MTCVLAYASWSATRFDHRMMRTVKYSEGLGFEHWKVQSERYLQVTHPVRTLANLARVARCFWVIGNVDIRDP